MNKYRDKSYFEINKAVAIANGYKVMSCEESVLAYIDSGYKPFDPCNNPADAMPIIIENKITVMYDSIGNTWCAHAGSVMDDCGWDYKIAPEHYADSDNYYRAAMEVFLIMKDAENEK